MIVMMVMIFSFCRVTLVERGSPHSLCLLESGKVGIVVPSYHSPLLRAKYWLRGGLGGQFPKNI